MSDDDIRWPINTGDCYRWLLSRLERLKLLVDLNAPRVLIDNEKRLVAESMEKLMEFVG